MPEFDAFLHYRVLDVSSFKEVIRRWYPKVYYASPEKHGGHRALADIRESIAELRYYRRLFSLPNLGQAPLRHARSLPSSSSNRRCHRGVLGLP